MKRAFQFSWTTLSVYIGTAAAGVCSLAFSPAMADPPATRPAAISSTQAAARDDTPEVKAIREVLIGWDKTTPKNSLEDERNSYHCDNQKEARFMDFLARENLEESRVQQAVRDKWGVEAEAKFAHFLGGTTLEDDRVCTIKIDGEHAQVNWDTISEGSPLPLIKVDSHWLVDVHALYAQAVKDDPTSEPQTHSAARVMKQAMADIVSAKFDGFDSFFDDFKGKYGSLPDGN